MSEVAGKVILPSLKTVTAPAIKMYHNLCIALLFLLAALQQIKLGTGKS